MFVFWENWGDNKFLLRFTDLYEKSFSTQIRNNIHAGRFKLMQGLLLQNGLLVAKMLSLLKIKIFSKSSFWVNVKVHNIIQKKFCKDMLIWFRFIPKDYNCPSTRIIKSRQEFLEIFESHQNWNEKYQTQKKS